MALPARPMPPGQWPQTDHPLNHKTQYMISLMGNNHDAWCLHMKKPPNRGSSKSLNYMAPRVGLEPTTNGLTVRRSTN